MSVFSEATQQQFKSSICASTGLTTQGPREKGFWDEACNSQKSLSPWIQKNVLISPDAVGPHCSIRALCLSTNLLASYIVPAPKIPQQPNLSHALILLTPLCILALLLPTFYIRENQGRRNLNNLSTAALFTRFSLHYSSRLFEISNMTLTIE